MITRCPHCATRFQVRPEQLAARQGMVRCGRCGAPFHALAAQEATLPATSPATGSDADSPSARPQSDLWGESYATRWRNLPVVEPAGHAQAPDAASSPAPAPDHEPAPLRQADQPVAEAPEPADRPELPSSHPVEPAPAHAPAADAEPDARDRYPQMAASAAAETPPGTEGATADQPEDRATTYALAVPAARRAPPRLDSWLPACVLLGLLLIGQAIYLARTAIAIAWPASRPLLADACRLLACEVGWAREPDRLSIDASEMVAEAGAKQVVRVQAVLRNRADRAQAYPALRLTLTDSLGRDLARRTLVPAEYLARAPRHAEGFAARSEIAARARVDLDGIGATGYRLEIIAR